MDSITQADRDAAALACRLTGWRAVADRLERGWTPDPDTNEGKIIQAFAAHRRTAHAQGMIEAARICGSLAETTYDDAEGFVAATGCEAAIMKAASATLSKYSTDGGV
jgi:hypothetical protein